MKNILLIQTGGTIAMKQKNVQAAAELDAANWSKVLFSQIPELSEIANIKAVRLFFEDSSDIQPEHWSRLIRFIDEKYEDYDGFVILHGTDTMAYTASALSFGLQNLSKPVILTGSQVPMSNLRSDARRNLVNAIEMATLPLHEVAICFNDHVFRGNRCTKMSIGDFDAFVSPNYPPLAEIGLNIELRKKDESSGKPLKTFPHFNSDLFLLKIFPGLNPQLLDKIDLNTVRAVVVEAFGSGNFPYKGGHSLLPFFKKCIQQQVFLVITSQAAYDSVELSNYNSGRKAEKMGALSAGDMTTEATLTKMMYLLANSRSVGEIADRFETSLAGEITEK